MRWFKRAELTWHTLVRLEPSQVGWRALRALQRWLPLPGARAIEPLASCLSALEAEVQAWAPGDVAGLRARVAALTAGEFDFVGQRLQLLDPDWLAHLVSPLWTYNLHYFDYAVDLAWAVALEADLAALARLERLVNSWIDHTADGRGPGWAPYPIATRVLNWAKVLLILGARLPTATRVRMGASLHRQLRVLAARLEWDLRANHLQRDLTALVVGSLLFEGAVARDWGARGTRWLWPQVERQVEPDGGHYERSPMYHAIALGDLLELLLLLRATGMPTPEAVEDRVRRLAGALGSFVRPDRSLHLFNDAVNGIAPPLEQLCLLAGRLRADIVVPEGNWALPVTGYFGLRETRRGFSLIVDAGAPGPRDQPGHAHCDLLSFELDAGGRALIIDAGVHGYDGDPFREYARSTRAHNTVMLGGREQSETWGTFRLGRRAIVRAAAAALELDGSWHFRGAYSPWYDDGVRHVRDIVVRGGQVTVMDEVSGGSGLAYSFLHLHPAWSLTSDGGSRLVATQAGSTVVIELAGLVIEKIVCGLLDPAQGWYFPRFGVAEPAPAIVLRAPDATTPFGYRIHLPS